MPHTGRTYPRKLASWLAPFIVASLLLAGFVLPGAQAAPQAPLTSPNQPTLVSPANAATGDAISPTLSDSVIDPAAAPSSEPAAANVAADFTLVVIPDPQNLATSGSGAYNSQTQWAVDHKISSNVVFVTSVGDMVNTSSSSTEYGRADAAFDILDAGSVAYSVGPGNHDMAMGTTLWPSYFGASRFSGKSWYGGSYDDYNSYSLFSASGMDFILINLQYNPGNAQITWANNLLQTYASRRGIVEQHDILNTNNTWANQTSYNTLRGNANLFLMLCGHMHTGSDGAAYVAGTGTDGHTIHVVMQDYQDFSAGYMRIYRFSPANDLIYMTTYAPFTGGSLTSTSNYDQADLAYVMPDAPPPTCYALTLNHGGNGSTPAASPLKSAACSTNGQYVAGEAITLSGAAPDAGWQISGWTGTSTNGSTANTNSLTMPTSAQSAGVTYTRIEYALTVNTVGNGTVTPDQPAPYYYNDAVQLTPASDPGWVFTGWSGACTGSGACSVTMTGDRTVTATFVLMVEPEAPFVTSIDLSGDDVSLTWNPVTKDENNNPTTIDEYRVYGSSEAPYFEPSALNLLGMPTPQTATTFTHATGGANWYYLVRAHNAVDESAVSNPRKGRFGFTLVPGS